MGILGGSGLHGLWATFCSWGSCCLGWHRLRPTKEGDLKLTLPAQCMSHSSDDACRIPLDSLQTSECIKMALGCQWRLSITCGVSLGVFDLAELLSCRGMCTDCSCQVTGAFELTGSISHKLTAANHVTIQLLLHLFGGCYMVACWKRHPAVSFAYECREAPFVQGQPILFDSFLCRFFVGIDGVLCKLCQT